MSVITLQDAPTIRIVTILCTQTLDRRLFVPKRRQERKRELSRVEWLLSQR